MFEVRQTTVKWEMEAHLTTVKCINQNYRNSQKPINHRGVRQLIKLTCKARDSTNKSPIIPSAAENKFDTSDLFRNWENLHGKNPNR